METLPDHQTGIQSAATQPEEPPLLVRCVSYCLWASLALGAFEIYLLVRFSGELMSVPLFQITVYLIMPALIALYGITGVGLWHMKKWGALLFLVPVALVIVLLAAFDIFNTLRLGDGEPLTIFHHVVVPISKVVVLIVICRMVWRLWRQGRFI